MARGSWLVVRGSTRHMPVLKTYKRLSVHQTDERTDEYEVLFFLKIKVKDNILNQTDFESLKLKINF